MSYYGYTTKKDPIDIYIDQWRCEETEEYVPLLLGLINQITPCGLERIKDKVYIKFHLMRTYDQSLVLLNFIRNLWHEPGCYDGYGYGHCVGYTKRFFQLLSESTEEDPLRRLMWANREAVPEKLTYGAGHSPVYGARNRLVINSAKVLHGYTGTASGFMTTVVSAERRRK